MYCYFARSLRGLRSENDEALYKSVVEIIRTLDWRPQFDIPVTVSRKGLSVMQYVKQRDLCWIDACQAMIILANNPSHGVGYEACYAEKIREIPILVLVPKGEQPSYLFDGMKVVEYTNLLDIRLIVEGFLKGAGRQ